MVAALTPGQAIDLAKQVADIYAAATAELVKVVAAQAARGIREPRTAHATLSQMVKLRQEAQRVVARAQKAGPAKAAQVVAQAYAGGLRQPVTDALSAVNQHAVHAYARALIGQLDQAGPVMLRWADDVYRRVVADTAHLAVSGAATRREAAARAMDRFAALGVTGFTAADGSTWRVDTYTEMATRTACQRAHLAGTVDRIQAHQHDLVVVSDSPTECAYCRPWEGQVLSLSGSNPNYPSYAAATASDLFHPNCTHTISAWIPGVTELPPPTADPEGYAAKQRQRELERRVRESRRRVEAAKQLGDQKVIGYNQRLLARRQAALRQHLADHPQLKAYRSRQRTSLGAR